MKVIADISIVPLGEGVSVSKYIAECQKIFREAGLTHSMHAYGTNLEGEWDEVFDAIKKCHTVLHQTGVKRISSNMRFGTRTDRDQSMQDKIKSVQDKLSG
ncbi:MAG: MTH1187 family thiamine-binding protein [Ignavibacteriaceae bacterium]